MYLLERLLRSKLKFRINLNNNSFDLKTVIIISNLSLFVLFENDVLSGNKIAFAFKSA